MKKVACRGEKNVWNWNFCLSPVLEHKSTIHAYYGYVTVCKNMYTGTGDTINFGVIKAAKGTR